MPISIRFEGWYQSRLATDPDPYDEPFGIEGAVLTVAGEPPLDRRIRFQPPGCVVRPALTPDLEIGVAVAEVAPELSALNGAPVELLDDAVFEGRNHLIANDGTEPIWPIHVRVGTETVHLDRAYSVVPVAAIPGEAFAWFAAAGPEAKRLLRDHGLPDGNPTTFVASAKQRLEQEAASSQDPDDKERFHVRATRLDRAAVFNGAQMQWRVWLTGSAHAALPADSPRVDLRSPWGLEMLSTGFLYDAMCAVLVGWLHVPLAGEQLDEGIWRQPARP